MKTKIKLMTLSLLASTLLAGSAQAMLILPQKSKVVLTCRDAVVSADAGLELSIITVPLAHTLVANVAEQSIAGPQPFGQVLVKQISTQDIRITDTVYQGENFLLTLFNNQEDEKGNIPALVSAELNGKVLDQEVSCQIIFSIQ